MVAEKRDRKRSIIRLTTSKFDAYSMTAQDALENDPFGNRTAAQDVLQPVISPLGEPQREEYLLQLFNLHSSGILTDQEYFAAKQRLLGG